MKKLKHLKELGSTMQKNDPNTLFSFRKLMHKTILVCSMAFAYPFCMVQADNLTIKVNTKGQVGFVDSSGNEVIKCQYQSATPFANGVSKVSKGNKYGFINEEGKAVLPIVYDNIKAWNDRDLLVVQKGTKYGLVDTQGTIKLDVKYTTISRLNRFGKAWISMSGKVAKTADGKQSLAKGKWGIINDEGEILIEPKHKGLYEFSFDATSIPPMYEGWRLEYASHYVGDTLKTDCQYMGYSKNSFTIYKAGVLDAHGNILVPEALYTIVMKPSSNMVRYYIEKKKNTICGYHNTESNHHFEVGSFNEYFGKLGVWTHSDFTHDIAVVNVQAWSFVDKQGNTIASGFKEINHGTSCDMWAARKPSGECIVLNEKGQTVQELSGYMDISFPSRKEDAKLFGVCKGNKWGVVDASGKEVVNFEYDKVLGVRYNTFAAKKANGWGMIDITGKSIVPCMYTDVALIDAENPKNVWVMKSDSLYYNFEVKTGKAATDGYKVVTNFKNGLAWVHPNKFTVKDNVINIAQAGSKVTSTEGLVKNFGIILREDNTIVFNEPLYFTYTEEAMKIINDNKNKVMNPSEIKKILLNLTQNRRSYPMNQVIEEENWDY